MYPIGINYRYLSVFIPVRDSFIGIYYIYTLSGLHFGVHWFTMATFILYLRRNGEYAFNLTKHKKQAILASEGYAAKAGCLNGIESVRHYGKIENQYEKKTTLDGRHYFNLKGGNGQTIVTSKLYETVSQRDKAIAMVQSIVAEAAVVDETANEPEQALTNWVKDKRKQLGLTQQQLAEKAGVGLRFLRELEQGKNTLRIDKVNQVLRLFGYEVGPVLINRNHWLDAEG